MPGHVAERLQSVTVIDDFKNLLALLAILSQPQGDAYLLDVDAFVLVERTTVTKHGYVLRLEKCLCGRIL